MTAAERKAITALISKERKRAVESLLSAGYSPAVIFQMKQGQQIAGFIPDENSPRKSKDGAVVVSGHTAHWASMTLECIRLFDEALAKRRFASAIELALKIGAAGQRQEFESHSLRGASKGGKKRVAQQNSLIGKVIECAGIIYQQQVKKRPRIKPILKEVYAELPDEFTRRVKFSTFARRVREPWALWEEAFLSKRLVGMP